MSPRARDEPVRLTKIYTRGGKKLDTCELKRVTWTATPTGGS